MRMRFLLLLPVIALASCQATRYYIVRHGEKAAPTAQMSSDVPLSPDGEARAQALQVRLHAANLQYVYSTDYIRTKGTAAPTASAAGLGLTFYDPKDTAFVSRVLAQGKGNTLIVGHSNTVDDLVNRFLGRTELQDLPDTAYGDLFIITKKGKRFTYRREHFGR
ncbi:MAG: histidine phosphatase family protein [Sphingobacteriales bacterium]|nr:MAG: histidine phosphatase family protein [Sphingobacteriales bacterium]